MVSQKITITGVGMAVPERVVPNSEIAAAFGHEGSWIEERTGIRQRRFAAPGDSASSLGLEASKEAIASAGIDPATIDAVIVGTSTPDYLFPPTAVLLQDALGIPSPAAFDLEAACSGYTYGLAAAVGLIAAGASKRALVVGVDLLSRHLDLEDSVTAPLFGDGAGATIVEEREEADPIVLKVGSDGSHVDEVLIPGGGSKLSPAPPEQMAVQSNAHYIHMSGREVYRQAVRTMSRVAADLGAKECDLLIAHQANRRILVDCAKILGLEERQVFVNIEKYGNTSAASVPIAIYEAWHAGRISPGDRVALLGFGAGYTWAGASLTWVLPKVQNAEVAEISSELTEVRS